MARRSTSRRRSSWHTAVIIEFLAVLAIGALAMYRSPAPDAAPTPSQQANLWQPSRDEAIAPDRTASSNAPRDIVWTDREVEERLENAGQALRLLAGQALREHWQDLTR